jgi:hypothetical protein
MDEYTAAAFHEAGHGVALWLLEDEPDAIRLLPDDETHIGRVHGGAIYRTLEHSDLGQGLAAVFVFQAGAIAEKLAGGPAQGDGADRRYARAVAEHLAGEDEEAVGRILESVERVTYRVMRAPVTRALTSRIANALLEVGSISGSLMTELCDRQFRLFELNQPKEVSMENTRTDEYEVRQARLRELGIATYPDSWDGAAAMAEHDQRLRDENAAVGRPSWSLDPLPKPVAEGPNEQVDLEFDEGSGRKKRTSRRDVDRALATGKFKYSEITDADGKKRNVISRSRPTTRALGPDGRMMEEER